MQRITEGATIPVIVTPKERFMISCRWPRLVKHLIISIFLLATAHASGFPVILSAEVDSNNSALIIEGSGFGTGAVVTLGTTRLNVQTATDTKIISTLFADAFLPGAYILRAQFSNGMLAMFVLPLGTVKPAGGCGTHRPTIILNLLTSAPQVGVPTVLQATATDQDLAVCGPAEYLSYSWKFLDFPAFSQTSFSTLGSMPTFIPDLGGTYTILGTVTDSTGRSASAAITIVVALPPPA